MPERTAVIFGVSGIVGRAVHVADVRQGDMPHPKAHH